MKAVDQKKNSQHFIFTQEPSFFKMFKMDKTGVIYM